MKTRKSKILWNQSNNENETQSRRKESLTQELVFIIVGLVAGTVLLCWFLNTVLLESYYVNHKQKTLLEGFETIDAQCASEGLDASDFDVTFDNLCANGNITVMVISADRTIVRSSINDSQQMLIEFMNIIFGKSVGETRILKEDSNYVIQKRTDERLDAEYLVLYGTLSNSDLILMKSALESIRESVKISNRFLAYVGIFAVIFSIIIIVLVSRRITTPLVRLADISKRMTELDFEVKYQPAKHRTNEIDVLGRDMNLMSETLEKTISELKSANNQLQSDIEKKNEIDEMRKEFLSNVSHELKTPLALIQGYAEGLKECVHDDAESRDFYCEVIMDEADKMNQMVKKLLTLNQLEFGKETVTMEHFDLTELITGVINSQMLLAEQSGIRIDFEADGPMLVWADEFKVEEVVTNYLSNAIHYASYEKRILIRYIKKADCVRVCVFNTGEPIPESELENVWIKFYKVDKARTREYGGSGIGLSIVKAIMESFHRECGVENHEDGVEFWFELDTSSKVE